MSQRHHYLACLNWLKQYRSQQASADGLAAIIVTVMLIPQSLAYAMLAGLPAHIGLYASILPLLAYALFGSSRVLSVGPVAVVSLMTAATVSTLAEPGTSEYLAAAVLLAALSGGILLLMGLLRLGWLANLLSHPVISGFITASGMLIATTQLQHIFGLKLEGHNLWQLGQSFSEQLSRVHVPTTALGLLVLVCLLLLRQYFKPLLIALGVRGFIAELLSKSGPVLAVLSSIIIVTAFSLDKIGIAIVGDIPQGLPTLSLPEFKLDFIQQLIPAAILISLVGFVESISVAQTLAAKRRQQINPNQELIGLGAANIASAMSGAYPVTGGFARSIVNYDAGAVTPMAGVFTALGIAITALFFTPWFHFLPKATLAATIIVAVLSLLDFKSIAQTWRYSRTDTLAMLTTISLVLFVGIELGIMAGIVASLALHLWKTSRPHIAEIGRLRDTEHFRNKLRHKVDCPENLLCLRVDESLYFANSRFLEDFIYDQAVDRQQLQHVIIQCSAINGIDFSAMESLESLNRRLQHIQVRLHLSEVKGPVMDQLSQSNLLEHLSGNIYLSHFQAFTELADKKHTELIDYCI